MPDVRDVARMAGVSPSTVSNVVRGSSVVAWETRERVQRAIAELGYVPNGLARNLRQRRNNALGYVVPDASNPFYAEVFKGILVEAQARGLTAMVVDTGYSLASEEEAIRTLTELRVVGIALVSLSGDEDYAKGLAASPCPVVMADTADPAWGVPCVVSENRGGARAAVTSLIERGHRRVAFIGEPVDLPVCRHRYEGYADALAAAGIPLDEGLVIFNEGLRRHKLEWGREIGRELLARAPGSRGRPTAVFAAGDLMAMGVLSAAMELGLTVPDDMAVVGFDDIEMAAYSWPPLTTVRQDRLELGRRAVVRILSPQGDGMADIVPTQLVVRRSG